MLMSFAYCNMCLFLSIGCGGIGVSKSKPIVYGEEEVLRLLMEVQPPYLLAAFTKYILQLSHSWVLSSFMCTDMC